MSQSFSRKNIEVRFLLASGSFAGGNTKIVRGLGVDCQIDKPGLPAKNSCKLTIWGMPLDDMAQLTTLAFEPLKVENNKVEVYAGESDDLALAFSGDITTAWPDFNTAPEVGFKVDAMTGYVAAVTPASPRTVSGSVDVASLMTELAANMGLTFTNNGVSGRLENPALYGSPFEQAQAIARQAACELIVDDGELVIQPWQALRAPSPVAWNKETGLRGYPVFTKDGISVSGLYAPGLTQGGAISIQSIVPKASGTWKITSLKHHLQANYPQAQAWDTSVEAAYRAGK